MSKILSEKRTVSYMIGLYCRKNHGTKHSLCASCETLTSYALERLQKCPFGDEKSACKHCKIHCYKMDMRDEIRKVMRYSGPRMFIYYPIDWMRHLFKKRKLL